MLTTGIILLSIGSVIGGWAFMCDAMLPVQRPKLAWGPLPLLVAVLFCLSGSVFLFIIKWYYGIIGIVAPFLTFNVAAAIWRLVYRMLRL